MNRRSLSTGRRATTPTWLTITASLIGLALLVSAAGCRSESGGGFAIYLVATDLPPDSLPVVSHLEIAEVPLLAEDDVISYDRATHEMRVTDSAYQRILELQVPLSGLSFAVCVDRAPTYAGAFVTSLSSFSLDGVVIPQPLEADTTRERCLLKIELGYPGVGFFTGEDPRDDPAVIQALERAGKLIRP